MIQSVRDFGLLRAAALAAATVISFEAESQLAMLAGVSEAVSYAMPIAIDALMIAALRARQRSAILAGSVLMGAANVASHLLTHSDSGTDSRVIAAVSLVPVLVILALELLVPPVAAHDEAPVAVAQPVRETASVAWPVSWIDSETLALLSDTSDETPATEAVTHEEETTHDETPHATAERLDDDAARRMAEEAYAAGVSARQASVSVTRSAATVARWYKEFRADGVRQLATSVS